MSINTTEASIQLYLYVYGDNIFSDKLQPFQTSSKASETGTNDDSLNKDDDDNDDDDDEDKVPPGSNIDPERLKSFNVSILSTKDRI